MPAGLIRRFAAREWGRGALTVPCAVAAVMGLLLAPSPASALTRGAFTASFSGSGGDSLVNPSAIAVDPQSGDIYVTNRPLNQQQTLTLDATGGTYTLSFKGKTTEPIREADEASEHFAGSLQEHLESISTIGPGNVFVFGARGGPYTIEFVGDLRGAEQPLLSADTSELTGAHHSVTVTLARGAEALADVEKFTPGGAFIYMFGSEVNATTKADLCSAGESCQRGTPTSSPGGFLDPAYLAVDPDSGDLYVADDGTQTISKFDASGHLVSAWGTGGQLAGFESLRGVTVDPGGELFAANGLHSVKRYSAEGQLVRTFETSQGLSLFGFATDTEDQLYAIDGGSLYTGYGAGEQGFEFTTFKFSGAFGELAGQIQPDEGPGAVRANGVTIAPSSNELYVLGRKPTTPYYVPGGISIDRYANDCQSQAGRGCVPLESFGGAEVPLAEAEADVLSEAQGVAAGTNGRVYVADTGHHRVAEFAPVAVPEVSAGSKILSETSAELTGVVTPDASGEVTECQFEYTHDLNETQLVTIEKATGGTFTLGLRGVTTQPLPLHATSQEVQTALEGFVNIGEENVIVTGPAGGPFTVRFVGELANTNLGTELEGSSSNLTPPGEAAVTVETIAVGVPGGSAPASVPCSPAAPYGGGEAKDVHAQISGLEPRTVYHFRLVAANPKASDVGSFQDLFIPLQPQASGETATEVHADVATINAQVNPGGGPATYRVEYVTQQQFEAGGFAEAAESPTFNAGSADSARSVSVHLGGLSHVTTYHYRIVIENGLEAVTGEDRTFTTLGFSELNDACPNAHVRQQTSAAGLLDCRAYELVSAANSGGYDVESSLIEGQTPFPGYPDAEDRVLYGVHGGGIPGTDHPTGRGVDPYLATRGPQGWSTEYIGIPANSTPSTTPFASTLEEADAGLRTFVFGGPELCAPCFADGTTGEPLRKPAGELVQGMHGSLEPGPGMTTAGFIGRHLSANGEDLIFGSTSKFEPEAQAGQISIYERDLKTNATKLISKAPGGGQLACLIQCSGDGIGALDVSADGSRVLLGQLVSEEGSVRHWHLYMSEAGQTIDLTPQTSKGVVFDGMSATGTGVFFSAEEHLTHEDESHTGPDIFEATISGGSSNVRLVSTGTGAGGNSSSCDPSANTARLHWNTTTSKVSCGDVAVGGGGGVAGDGTIYFLTPEQLDPSDNAVPDAPNLYVARPGQAPHFIATLQSSLDAPLPYRVSSFQRNFGSFEKPTGVAISEAPGEAGDFYVLDTSNTIGGSVRKFDAQGNPVSSFGKQGTVEGQGATGVGELQSGSTTIESVTLNSGTFEPGQSIVGTGIPAGTTIEGVETGEGKLQISQAVTISGSESLRAKRPLQEYGYAGIPGGIAVDNDPSSPSYGDLYVPDAFGAGLDIFNSAGEFLSDIAASFSTAVAVDQANGDIYLSEFSSHTVKVLGPLGNSITTIETNFDPTGVAVDEKGTVYVVNGGGLFGAEGVTEAYEPIGTSPLEYGKSKLIDTKPSYGVAVGPEGSVYVDEGLQVAQFDPSGNRLATIGAGLFKEHSVIQGPTASIGLGAGAQSLIVSNPGSGPGETGNIEIFRSSYPPSPRTDNPLVLDSVSAPEVRHTGDFQVTPSGDQAVFTSSLPSAGRGEETGGHSEVYRYDASTEALTCVSCTITGTASAGEAALAADGLSLIDDGNAVFFDTSDALVGADTDNKQDAYEWELPGQGNCGPSSPAFNEATGSCLALISAGTSAFPSGLLGATANGHDAYFFTRDSLAPQDENGPTLKIYDAREEGGFPYTPPAAACRASDECHGASSPPPPPLKLSSESGTPHSVETKKPKACRHGFSRRHGKCIRRHRPPRRHHRHRGGRR